MNVAHTTDPRVFNFFQKIQAFEDFPAYPTPYDVYVDAVLPRDYGDAREAVRNYYIYRSGTWWDARVSAIREWVGHLRGGIPTSSLGLQAGFYWLFGIPKALKDFQAREYLQDVEGLAEPQPLTDDDQLEMNIKLQYWMSRYDIYLSSANRMYIIQQVEQILRRGSAYEPRREKAGYRQYSLYTTLAMTLILVGTNMTPGTRTDFITQEILTPMIYQRLSYPWEPLICSRDWGKEDPHLAQVPRHLRGRVRSLASPLSYKGADTPHIWQLYMGDITERAQRLCTIHPQALRPLHSLGYHMAQALNRDSILVFLILDTPIRTVFDDIGITHWDSQD